MSDRVLRLPSGTWHIFAIAEFATGDCAPGLAASERYSLRAEIVVVVADDPAATPGPPEPTRFLNQPVYGGDDIGDFTMQLKAGHSTYVAGEPIDVSAWYTFGSGMGDSIMVSHFAPEMAFSISEVSGDAEVLRSLVYDADCQEVTLTDGVERYVPLIDDHVLTIKAAAWPPSTADALREGILRLPVGRWAITVVVETSLGPCGTQGEGRRLQASIEVEVVSPGGAEAPASPNFVIELRTATQPTSECPMARGGGTLALHPGAGLGVRGLWGDVSPVTWPFGYTARRGAGGAVLLDPQGRVVAREGGHVTYAGGAIETDDGGFFACSHIEVSRP
jgi:hypothetical protein